MRNSNIPPDSCPPGCVPFVHNGRRICIKKDFDDALEERNEAVEKLEEIKEKIRKKAEEARDIVHDLAINSGQGDIADSYWYPQIVTALSSDSGYLGASMYPLDHTIEELRNVPEDIINAMSEGC